MKGGAFEIAGRKIGGGRTFVIAEAGTNHDGSLDKAREMVRIAADCPLICPTVVDATIAGHFASGRDYTMNDVPGTFPRRGVSAVSDGAVVRRHAGGFRGREERDRKCS